jgi:Response regulator containing CheY-like receiver, AAA-type ATPase, and DNA-binding domains
MNKKIFHILVVDDDDRIKELVKQYLEEKKFLVTTAKDLRLQLQN